MYLIGYFYFGKALTQKQRSNVDPYIRKVTTKRVKGGIYDDDDADSDNWGTPERRRAELTQGEIGLLNKNHSLNKSNSPPKLISIQENHLPIQTKERQEVDSGKIGLFDESGLSKGFYEKTDSSAMSNAGSTNNKDRINIGKIMPIPIESSKPVLV